LPTEIRNQVLRIRPDHVIEAMLHRFGAELVKAQSSFQPEGGAYSDHAHHHDNDHSVHHHA
jgi:urease accessory protein